MKYEAVIDVPLKLLLSGSLVLLVLVQKLKVSLERLKLSNLSPLNYFISQQNWMA